MKGKFMFSKVLKTIDNEDVNQFEISLAFRGTHGRKRKNESRSIKFKTMSRDQLLSSYESLGQDEFLTLFKKLAVDAINNFKCLACNNSYEISFQAYRIEPFSQKCDSNLIFNRPRYKFNFPDHSV